MVPHIEETLAAGLVQGLLYWLLGPHGQSHFNHSGLRVPSTLVVLKLVLTTPYSQIFFSLEVPLPLVRKRNKCPEQVEDRSAGHLRYIFV